MQSDFSFHKQQRLRKGGGGATDLNQTQRGGTSKKRLRNIVLDYVKEAAWFSETSSTIYQSTRRNT